MTFRMISGRSSRRREIYPEEGGVMFHKASLQGVPSEHLPAAHALRRPLPGIPHSLRLDDAGDAKPALITLLTTEHYNLQMQRVATISESNGRASVFLGAVSAGLIALGFESTRGASPIGHMIFQVLVLTPLVFLGLVAFMRCLEIAIDDWEFITRITRLRRTYDQLIPELAPLMSQAVADEGTAAMLSPRWQPFQKMLSVAGSVAVITSVVLGGDAGVIVFGISRMLYLAIALGTAAGALALGWATWYQWHNWCQASGPPSRDITPSRGCGAPALPPPMITIGFVLVPPAVAMCWTLQQPRGANNWADIEGREGSGRPVHGDHDEQEVPHEARFEIILPSRSWFTRGLRA